MPEPDPNGAEAGSLRVPPVQEIVRNGDVVVVRLAGELDLYNAPTVREALGDVVAERPERLVVDLGAVDSSTRRPWASSSRRARSWRAGARSC